MVTVVGAATETALGGSAMGVAATLVSVGAEIEMVASLGAVANMIESVSAVAVEAVMESRIELMRATLELVGAVVVEAGTRVAMVGCFDSFFPEDLDFSVALHFFLDSLFLDNVVSPMLDSEGLLLWLEEVNEENNLATSLMIFYYLSLIHSLLHLLILPHPQPTIQN